MKSSWTNKDIGSEFSTILFKNKVYYVEPEYKYQLLESLIKKRKHLKLKMRFIVIKIKALLLDRKTKFKSSIRQQSLN